MSNNKIVNSVADITRINANHPYEMYYWSIKFGCTKQELRKAIKATGSLLRNVEIYIGILKK